MWSRAAQTCFSFLMGFLEYLGDPKVMGPKSKNEFLVTSPHISHQFYISFYLWQSLAVDVHHRMICCQSCQLMPLVTHDSLTYLIFTVLSSSHKAASRLAEMAEKKRHFVTMSHYFSELVNSWFLAPVSLLLRKVCFALGTLNA